MAATAVRTTTLIPHPRSSAENAGTGASAPDPSRCRAAAYQRVLHQLVRRELRLLADLATWAPADEPERTAALTGHADLISRVLLHHHAVEREAVWPALVRAVPADRADEVQRAQDDWSIRCAHIDQLLRDLPTAARQWQVAGSTPARLAFASACRTLADAVDVQTADEERTVLPLLATYLEPGDWAAIARSSRCRLPAREQLLVLGLALEDATADDRARLLEGLPRSARAAWRLHGRRHYRAAVVRLRGAPPSR
jgi:Hemerythrin HHE cation binding domain